jgi:hypothetical protein
VACGLTKTDVGDYIVVAAGGNNDIDGNTDQVDVYNIPSGTWSTTPSLPIKNNRLGMVVTKDNQRMFVIGGISQANLFIQTYDQEIHIV